MMRGIDGYGRYDDDPQHVACPRAKFEMSPCVARDGSLALSSGRLIVCVGCEARPNRLLQELAESYEPARRARTGNPQAAADRLAEFVRDATEPPPRG